MEEYSNVESMNHRYLTRREYEERKESINEKLSAIVETQQEQSEHIRKLAETVSKIGQKLDSALDQRRQTWSMQQVIWTAIASVMAVGMFIVAILQMKGK